MGQLGSRAERGLRTPPVDAPGGRSASQLVPFPPGLVWGGLTLSPKQAICIQFRVCLSFVWWGLDRWERQEEGRAQVERGTYPEAKPLK